MAPRDRGSSTSLGAYFIDAASMAVYHVWSSISGGGALGLAVYGVLWPVVLILVFLMYLGVLHHPIELRIFGLVAPSAGAG